MSHARAVVVGEVDRPAPGFNQIGVRGAGHSWAWPIVLALDRADATAPYASTGKAAVAVPIASAGNVGRTRYSAANGVAASRPTAQPGLARQTAAALLVGSTCLTCDAEDCVRARQVQRYRNALAGDDAVDGVDTGGRVLGCRAAAEQVRVNAASFAGTRVDAATVVAQCTGGDVDLLASRRTLREVTCGTEYQRHERQRGAGW